MYQDAAEGALARKDDRVAEAVCIAKMADVVILCMGLDGKFEGEDGDANNPYASGDKKSLELPGRQMALLKAVLDTGKPVVLLLGTGQCPDLWRRRRAVCCCAEYVVSGRTGRKGSGRGCCSGRLPRLASCP